MVNGPSLVSIKPVCCRALNCRRAYPRWRVLGAVSTWTQAKEWQRSLALMVRMQHEGMTPTVVCYNSVINSLGMSGEWQRAEVVMENMIQANIIPNIISWNTLAQAFVIVSSLGDRAPPPFGCW